jgi:hypothetical protein
MEKAKGQCRNVVIDPYFNGNMGTGQAVRIKVFDDRTTLSY